MPIFSLIHIFRYLLFNNASKKNGKIKKKRFSYLSEQLICSKNKGLLKMPWE